MNPILPPNIHMADGEARVIGDKIYLFGSRDEAEGYFCSDRYEVACTKDLEKWEIVGPVLESGKISWAEQAKLHSSVRHVKCFEDLPEHIRNRIPEECRAFPIEQIVCAIEEQATRNLPEQKLLYAPDAIEKDGKTYLYFCMSDDSEGVGIADHPTDLFEEIHQMRFQRSKKTLRGIDPSIFIDTDGTVYYYWGQFQAKAARLSENMYELLDETFVDGILTEELHHFHEGSSIRKRGDWYYYIFTDVSRGKPTCLGYAMSRNPLGPYEYKGVIIDNERCAQNSWNNHGSIEEIHGKWYVFYHRSSGKTEYMRRMCAEPIYFDEEGLIHEVEPTSQGLGKPFQKDQIIPAYTACEVSGSAYVTDGRSGDQLVVEEGRGTAVFRYLENSEQIFRVIINGQGKGTVIVYSDQKEVWKGRMEESEAAVSIGPGIHEIKLEIEAEEKIKIKEIQFT